ncbi:MAG TPA: hypothetical protein VHV83_20740 [Armatimonadota bacterium]|nr:hypothetical protein [Armatimonadota bacterium]
MQVDLTPSVTSKRPSWWKMAINIALPVGLVGIFAWQIYKNWPAIKDYQWSLHWGIAVLGIAVLLLNSCLEIMIWNRTLSWFTTPLTFTQAAPVYIWSSLARYIPGKVASLFVRVALTNELQIDLISVLASSTVELALRTASGLFLFIIALVLSGAKTGMTLYIAPVVVIPLVLICAHPKVMLPVMNWALKKIKQPTIERTLRYREVLGIFVATIVRWCIYGLGFALLAWAIFPQAIHHVPVLVGTASGSWAAGFIGMSPGGIGLAEWVQNAILQGTLHFPKEIALILPVLFRLGTLVAEGSWALVAIFLWRKR